MREFVAPFRIMDIGTLWHTPILIAILLSFLVWQLVCNEGMERDIASASDLRSISEQARILSVFTPAW
jgi:hypothetical protein